MPDPASAHQSETERNMAIVRTFLEAMNRRDFPTAFQFMDPNVSEHHTRLADHNMQGVDLSFRVTMEAFPDLQWEIEDLIAESDKVVARCMVQGTHLNNFMGKPATNRLCRWRAIDISRIRDGKVVEHWGVFDELHIFAQIGLVPEFYLSSMS